jgi:predicted glycoside hydrolase/deacetylase ChbG (UPF0249 family)
MARRIVFIADDFGLDDEVNAAILDAHLRGALQGAALMMGQPGTEGAVELARRHPSLAVGWHLHLTDSRPCTRAAWPWGSSPARAGFAIGLAPAMRRLAVEDMARQWDAFLATGLDCRFVNAHHHLHVHPLVRPRLLAMMEGRFGGWLRWGRPRFFGATPAAPFYHLLDLLLQAPLRPRIRFATSTTLWGIDRTFAMSAAEVERVIPTLGDGLHEFMFHPRRAGEDADSRCLLALAGSPRRGDLS